MGREAGIHMGHPASAAQTSQRDRLKPERKRCFSGGHSLLLREPRIRCIHFQHTGREPQKTIVTVKP